ncbi:MAG: PIN domain-containing protein [Verrucomicrobiales bacterium]|nr:PIN domain-containing protein [Verrucomicrobiales bacterium]
MDQEVLVDSNVYIDLLRSGRDPAKAIFDRYESVDVVTCGMVQLEVLRGVKLPKHRQWLEDTFSLMMNVPTDNQLWAEAIDLAWKMDRSGRTIPAQDLLISACALSVDAAIHTFDRHFLEVPGLTVLTDPF